MLYFEFVHHNKEEAMEKVLLGSLNIGARFTVEHAPSVVYIKTEANVFKTRTGTFDIIYESVNAVVYTGTRDHISGTLEYVPKSTKVTHCSQE